MGVSAAELFRRHHLAIYRFVLRMTGRRDVADDVTQDVFVRVMRGLEGYDAHGRELAWLLTIARHLLIDRARRNARERSVPLEDDVRTIDRVSERVLLAQALDRLPEADREVFVLRVVSGLGHAEIARVVGASPAAVRCRIYRARAALRSMLGDADGRRAEGGTEAT